MTRLVALASTLGLLAACAPEAMVVADDGDRAFNPGVEAVPTAEFRTTLAITDHGDGTWEGTETSTWIGHDGGVLCDVEWQTWGVVDQNQDCEGCDIVWDVLCSEARVTTEAGSCRGYASSESLTMPADFWIGFTGELGQVGEYWTGDDDSAGQVYWGVAGTATFDGVTLVHDDTIEL